MPLFCTDSACCTAEAEAEAEAAEEGRKSIAEAEGRKSIAAAEAVRIVIIENRQYLASIALIKSICDFVYHQSSAVEKIMEEYGYPFGLPKIFLFSSFITFNIWYAGSRGASIPKESVFSVSLSLLYFSAKEIFAADSVCSTVLGYVRDLSVLVLSVLFCKVACRSYAAARSSRNSTTALPSSSNSTTALPSSSNSTTAPLLTSGIKGKSGGDDQEKSGSDESNLTACEFQFLFFMLCCNSVIKMGSETISNIKIVDGMLDGPRNSPASIAVASFVSGVDTVLFFAFNYHRLGGKGSSNGPGASSDGGRNGNDKIFKKPLNNIIYYSICIAEVIFFFKYTSPIDWDNHYGGPGSGYLHLLAAYISTASNAVIYHLWSQSSIPEFVNSTKPHKLLSGFISVIIFSALVYLRYSTMQDAVNDSLMAIVASATSFITLFCKSAVPIQGCIGKFCGNGHVGNSVGNSAENSSLDGKQEGSSVYRSSSMNSIASCLPGGFRVDDTRAGWEDELFSSNDVKGSSSRCCIIM